MDVKKHIRFRIFEKENLEPRRTSGHLHCVSPEAKLTQAILIKVNNDILRYHTRVDGSQI